MAYAVPAHHEYESMVSHYSRVFTGRRTLPFFTKEWVIVGDEFRCKVCGRDAEDSLHKPLKLTGF